MTLIAGFIVALVAGWIVREPRRAAATVILPYLAMVAVQTWGLARGYGINPPSTVTPLSGAISYYVVQVVLGLVLVAIAAEVAVLRAPGRGGRPAVPAVGPWYRAAVASAICDTGVFVLLVGSLVAAKLVSHHSTSSPMPLVAVLGVGLNLIAVIAFGIAAVVTLIRARRRSAAAPDPLGTEPAVGTAVR